MATLTGTAPKDTYKDLLQVSNSNSGIDATLRFLSDGEGTDSTLKLSTTTASFTTALTVTGILTATAGIVTGGVIVSDTDGTDDIGTTGVRFRYGYFDDMAVTNGVVAANLDGILGANTPAPISGTTGTYSGIFNITNNTDSTSISSGASQNAGGQSITKQLWVGGSAHFTNTVDIINGTLTLSAGGTANGSISCAASCFINIDSDNGATNEKFVIAKDATGTGGTELFKVQENGEIFANLPTSAGTAGSLWNDSGTVKVA